MTDIVDRTLTRIRAYLKGKVQETSAKLDRTVERLTIEFSREDVTASSDVELFKVLCSQMDTYKELHTRFTDSKLETHREAQLKYTLDWIDDTQAIIEKDIKKTQESLVRAFKVRHPQTACMLEGEWIVLREDLKILKDLQDKLIDIREAL